MQKIFLLVVEKLQFVRCDILFWDTLYVETAHFSPFYLHIKLNLQPVKRSHMRIALWRAPPGNNAVSDQHLHKKHTKESQKLSKMEDRFMYTG